jgi:hypothetical protein
MKKILVFLLVLAVSTGVFAQGEWSVSASGSIEAMIDLNNWTDAQIDTAQTGDTAPYKALTNVTEAVGSVGISYEDGPFSGGIDFAQDGAIGLWANVWDETDSGNVYEFQLEGKLVDLLVGSDDAFQLADTSRITALWGYYEMLSGMIHLEAAYKGRDTAYWESDTTGAFGGSFVDWEKAVWAGLSGTVQQKHAAFPKLVVFDDGGTWSGNDGNYLLTNVSIGTVEFGFKMPWFNGEDDGTGWFTPPTPITAADPYRSDLFIESILKKMVIGAKFDMFPIVAAIQLHIENYGVYFGGTFELGQLTAGLSFMGELNTPAEDLKLMKAGVSVAYTTDTFGGGVKGKLEIASITVGTNAYSATTIGIEPNFFINAIPTHLRFGLDTGFYFITPAIGVDKDPMEAAWAVEPALYWNFLGTEATDEPGTGFIFKYRVLSGLYSGDENIASENKLTLAFKWAYN